MVQIPVEGKVKPVLQGGRVADIADIDGALVKDVTTAGLVTLQMADGTEATVQLAMGGGTTFDAAFVQALTARTLLDDSDYVGLDDQDRLSRFNISHLRAWMQANLARFLPTHGDMETDRYPVATGTANAYALRRGAPPALPAAPNQAVVSNAAGDAYELAHHLIADDIFPHVAVLPDHTLATAPELVYLDHNIVSGPRQDATITVGRVGSLGWGWSTYSGGSINRSNPGIVGIYGIGNAGNYSINTVAALNEALLRTLTSITIAGTTYTLGAIFRSGSQWLKAITNGPTGLSAATLAVNFQRSDTTFFFVGSGGLTTFFLGLYEKLNTGYSRIISSGFSHTRGNGPPTVDPQYEGQAYINELGQLWVAGGTFRHTETDTTGTSSAFVHAKYVRNPADQPAIISQGGDGGFWWPPANQTIGNFWQSLGTTPPLDQQQSWLDVWTYIYTVAGQVNAANLRLRDHSVYFGGFSSAQDAYDALDRMIAQDAFDAGTTDYYWGFNTSDPNDHGIMRLNTWAAATVVETDTLFWNGPFYTVDDLVNWVRNNAEELNASLEADGHYTLSILERGEIASNAHQRALLGDMELITEKGWTASTDIADAAFNVGDTAITTVADAAALTYVVTRDTTQFLFNADVTVRLPLMVTIGGEQVPADVHDYRLVEQPDQGVLVLEWQTAWLPIGSDATYQYYRLVHNIHEFYDLTIEHDLARVTGTDFHGQIHNHEIVEVSRAAYDALTTYVDGAWYVIQEAA